MAIEIEADKRDRMQNVLIYVIGEIDTLKFMGFISGGPVEMTDKGREVFLKLKEQGFKPTTEEIHEAMAILLSGE